MRASFVLPLLALSSCATAAASGVHSASEAAAPVTGSRISVSGGQVEANVVNEVTTVSTRMAFPPDRVWGALARAFADVGVQVKTVDQATRTMGNLDYHPHGSIGGRRLSEYFDCGNSNLGASIADLYSLRVSIQARVSAAEDGSRLDTRVTAFARDMNGTSSSPVHCDSRGRLEASLQAALLNALQP